MASEKLPETPLRACRGACVASETAAATARAWRRNWLPSKVSSMPLAWRRKSSTPVSCSSALMASVTDDCETPSCEAASDSLPASAVAMK